VGLGGEHFALTYFDTRTKNSIEYGGVWPNDLYYNLNGKSHFKGFEAEASYNFLGFFDTSVSYTHLDAKDAEGRAIARRPRQSLAGSLTMYTPHNLIATLTGRYVGTRYDASGGAQTGRYFTADALIEYILPRDIKLYARVRNIFDRYYQEVDGYGTYGRSFYLGVRGGF
jgi:vitamin B12 transporter